MGTAASRPYGAALPDAADRRIAPGTPGTKAALGRAPGVFAVRMDAMGGVAEMRRPAAEKPPELYYYPQYDCYECLGCGEMLEVPYRAVLKGGQEAVDVKRHPENRLLWVELMTLDHAKCDRYRDAARAKSAREFRR